MSESLYRKASLVMNPYGALDGELPSIKPTDGSGDFTFSRDGAGASPATRVNASGLIEKGRENVLLQSNQFDTTWVSLNTTETGGQSGYDGSNNAWLITKSAASARVYQTISTTGVQTFSVYAKAGSLNWVAVSNNLVYTYFNLSTGTIGTNVGTIDANIESVGSGWYRCSIVYTGSAIDARIYPSQGDNDSSGTSGNIYIQDAQLEQGLVATDYIETTTAPVSAGLLGDMPRLDYSGGATCPSLLLEPSRVNLLGHSEYFGGWTTFGSISLLNNATTSPEGVSNAAEFSNGGGVYRTDTFVANTDYVLSVFIKTNGATAFSMNYADQTSPFRGGTITYNFASDSIAVTQQSDNGSVSGDRELFSNGWVRLIMKFKTNVAANYSYQQLGFTGPAGYVFGAQLEQASYPTSYIPTYGSASTRGEDKCNKTSISDLIGQSEGSVFVEFDLLQLDGFGGIIDLATSPVSSSTRIMIWETSANKLEANFGSFGSAISTDATIGRHKGLVTYSGSVCKFFLDGVKVGEMTPSTAPTGFSELTFIAPAGGVKFQKKQIQQTLLFKTALTDAECIALTQI